MSFGSGFFNWVSVRSYFSNILINNVLVFWWVLFAVSQKIYDISMKDNHDNIYYNISYYVIYNSSLSLKAIKPSVRLYHQLFVGGLMSYLRYLCLVTYSGVKHILSCHVLFFFFCFFFFWSCVSYVTSFSGLYIFDCPFGVL